MDTSLSQFEIKYEDNEIIFCEYEKGDSFYFIKQGNVKLIRQVDNKETILDVLSPGVFFGEMAIIEAEPRSATAVSEGEVVLLKFSSENFESVVLQNSNLVSKLIRTFVDRIWAQQQRLQIYKFHEIAPRIIAMMLNLKTGKEDGRSTVSVNVTLDDLSKWVGTTKAECKKVLHGLMNSGVITVQEKSIIVNDLGALERQLSLHSHMLEKESKEN